MLSLECLLCDFRESQKECRQILPGQMDVDILHKNGYDERQLSKSIKIFIEGDIVFVTIKFFEDGQYGLDIYTRDAICSADPTKASPDPAPGSKKHLLTHCCKYLINVRTTAST